MEQRIDALEKRLARFRGGKGRNDADDVNGDNDVTGGDDDEAAKDGLKRRQIKSCPTKFSRFRRRSEDLKW